MFIWESFGLSAFLLYYCFVKGLSQPVALRFESKDYNSAAILLVSYSVSFIRGTCSDSGVTYVSAAPSLQTDLYFSLLLRYAVQFSLSMIFWPFYKCNITCIYAVFCSNIFCYYCDYHIYAAIRWCFYLVRWLYSLQLQTKHDFRL